MDANELMDHLTWLAVQCGRGEAYVIRRAAGIDEHGNDQSEAARAAVKALIQDTFAGCL